jgi:hypothetical protein
MPILSCVLRKKANNMRNQSLTLWRRVVPERFISENIVPDPESFDTAGMAVGGPGLPRRFSWRGKDYAIVKVLEKWKETGPCVSGSDERYVRKHWFKIEADSGDVMKIYYERQPKSKRQARQRWVLFTIEQEAEQGDVLDK